MSALSGIAITALVLGATAGLTLAVVSLFRIPETYVKVHAISLGLVLGPCLAAVASIFTVDSGVIFRAFLAGAFLIITAPVAAHAIIRVEAQRRERDGGET